ncbi:MAG: hypothetical protein K0U74_13620 [Alphaproteobacteria bacterium]|nr:hypothetical protein [Alphaproteobacteria bacterium]
MRKTFYVVIGLVIIAVSAGGMWYRINNDPGAARRFDWAMEKIGVGQDVNANRQAPDAPAGRSGRLSEHEARSKRREDRRERRQNRDQLELFKLGLDLANIVVGLIGIYLAYSGMRMRSGSS